MSDFGKQSHDLKDSVPSFVPEHNNDKMVSVVNAISKSRILYKTPKRTQKYGAEAKEVNIFDARWSLHLRVSIVYYDFSWKENYEREQKG